MKQENNKIEINSKCRNNHKKICSLNDFVREIIKNNFNSICCSQCKCERQNLFFYCYHYKLYFCKKCHINHKNSITNINTISIDNLDSNCELHNDKIIAL